MEITSKSETSGKPTVGIFLPHSNLSKVVAEMLTEEGFGINRYFNKLELMASIQKGHPDALVMDMDMSGAMEISQQARKIHPDLVVLMISTLADRELPEKRISIHSFASSWRDMISELRQMLNGKNEIQQVTEYL